MGLLALGSTTLGAISALPGVFPRPRRVTGRDLGIPRRIFAPSDMDKKLAVGRATYEELASINDGVRLVLDLD